MAKISTHMAEAGIVTISLNRPEKRNALDNEMIAEFTSALTAAEQDPRVTLIQIKACGEHFCAGADIKAMLDNQFDSAALAQLLKQLHFCSKPTIGLVHGTVMGGGVGLVACMDIVIAVETASFCFSEVKIGLVPSVISPYVLAAMGERAARYYFLTAQHFSAKEALRLQLIHQLVPQDKLMQAGLSLAHEMVKNSLYAMQECKKLISKIHNEPISDELIQTTVKHLTMMRAHEDTQKRFSNFIEKK